MKAFLTSKVDGSLLVVSKFEGEALKIVLPVVEEIGTDFVKLWASQSYKLTNGKAIYVPSTNGTIFEGGFMQDYITTAILSGGEYVSRTDLQKFETSLDAWTAHGDAFFKDLEKIQTTELSDSHTFTFEGVCLRSQGLWKDSFHKELGSNYPYDGIFFLGMSISNRRFFVPHFKVEHPFAEPLWWEIKNGGEVDTMLEALNDVIFGEMTVLQFLKKFEPGNKGFAFSDDEKTSSKSLSPYDYGKFHLDPEGFVILKEAVYKVTDPDHLLVMEKRGLPFLVYSKCKTEAYYKSHKPREEDYDWLVKLSVAPGACAFPFVIKLASLLKDGAFQQRIIAFCKAVIEYGTIPNLVCEVLTKVDGNGDVVVDVVIEYKHPMDVGGSFYESIEKSFAKLQALEEEKSKAPSNQPNKSKSKPPTNPLANWGKYNVDAKWKIALANMDKTEMSEIVALLRKAFPEISADVDAGFIARNLLMLLTPWKEGYEEQVKKIDIKSPSVKFLVSACLPQNH